MTGRFLETAGLNANSFGLDAYFPPFRKVADKYEVPWFLPLEAGDILCRRASK